MFALFLLFPVLLGVLFIPIRSDTALLVHDTATAIHPTRVLLLIAHPDDECFFFGPTITSLVRDGPPESTPELFALSLSTGNANGLGELRQSEWSDSLDILGIDAGKRWVENKPSLRDDLYASWGASVVANTVKPYVLENNITTILTFDYRGISMHPNHISLFFGVSRLLSDIRGTNPPVRAFSLVSVPTLVKYVGVAAPLLAKLDLAFSRALTFFGFSHPFAAKGATHSQSALPVFVAGVDGYLTAARAIVKHRSQLVWYRYLYLVFSRYMWVNEWVEIPAGVRPKL
ncbi:LmbE-like protein [Artomyces pyxidatus]|uniref:LmbE-like protein n=1 Tax=Artomyces pyxidatus TaxID=48021 RepID=A0ACB8TEH2_9AGAM|nr:LmbE-like protein [Artomyces pyxidatus]